MVLFLFIFIYILVQCIWYLITKYNLKVRYHTFNYYGMVFNFRIQDYITTMENIKVVNGILSSLDQFEVRNLVSLDAPVLGNLHLSVTNIGLYLTVAALISVIFFVVLCLLLIN